MTVEKVEFITEDRLRLVGNLRVAAAATTAVVFTGPFTGVKEQVVARYAEGLATAGITTLAFDHRNFGESQGAVRQHEDAAGKLTDLRAAVSLLRQRGYERVGLAGVCLGAGYALKAAAQDPRVSAVACVAGAYPDAPSSFAGSGAEYREALRPLVMDTSREVEYVKAVSDDGSAAAMPGKEPFEYYGTKRSFSPHWENRVSAASPYQIMTLDAAAAAQWISPTPLLVVHGEVDGFCSPAAARAVYERAGEPKRLRWLPTTNHIDLYDVEEHVEPAVAELVEFFSQM